MAFFHRKLFLYVTSTSSDVTAPCNDDFCTCSNALQHCYNSSDWVPPISLLSPPTAVDHGFNCKLSPLSIIMIILLTSVFVLVTYYVVFVKHCFTRSFNPGDPPEPGHTDHDLLFNNNMGDDDDQHHDDLMIDYYNTPVWLHSSLGLQESVINSIKVIRFKRGDIMIEGNDCSVCLSEFQEDQSLRLLPKCKHAFHIDCIDTWLRSHYTCPLCRAAVVFNSVRPSVGPNESNFMLTQVEDSDSSDVELGDNQKGDGSGVSENRGDSNYRIDNNINTSITISITMNQVRRCFSMDTRNAGDPNSQIGSHAPLKRSYSWRR